MQCKAKPARAIAAAAPAAPLIDTRLLSFSFQLFSLLLLCSCQAGRPIPPPGTDDALAASDAAAGEAEDQSAEGKDAPIEVSIGHAFEDAENLNVKVLLKAMTDIDPKQVAVSLIGLHEGEVRQQDTKVLSDEFSGETFESGTTLAVLFKLNRRDLTEYQIKVGWGSDASDLVKNVIGADGAASETAAADSASTASLARSRLEEQLPPGEEGTEDIALTAPKNAGGLPLTIENAATDQAAISCKSQPCDRRYVVTAVLVNRSAETVQGAQLGLGLYWVENSGRLVTPPDGKPLQKNEEQIDLTSLALGPGGRKKIRVTVDRPIPVVPGGEFHAHLRIVKAGL